MSAARKLRRSRNKTAVLCVRIGQTGNRPIPADYQTGDCSRCGSAVWVHPDSAALAQRSDGNAVYLCNVCVPPPKAG